MLESPHRLHTAKVVHDGEPVEGQTAVGEMVDVLNTEGVGTSVCNLVDGVTLMGNIPITAEYCPDTAHSGWITKRQRLIMFKDAEKTVTK